jgi:hypothetical protein
MNVTIETREYAAIVQVNYAPVPNSMIGSLIWSIKLPLQAQTNARGDRIVPRRLVLLFDQAADGTVLLAQHEQRDSFSSAAWAELQAAASGILRKARAVGLHCHEGRGATVNDAVVEDLVREVHSSWRLVKPPVRVSGMQPR